MAVKQTGQGYNFNSDRGRKIARWLALIEKDQNYARILFRLPLKHRVSRGAAEMAEKFGYRGRQPPRR